MKLQTFRRDAAAGLATAQGKLAAAEAKIAELESDRRLALAESDAIEPVAAIDKAIAEQRQAAATYADRVQVLKAAVREHQAEQNLPWVPSGGFGTIADFARSRRQSLRVTQSRRLRSSTRFHAGRGKGRHLRCPAGDRVVSTRHERATRGVSDLVAVQVPIAASRDAKKSLRDYSFAIMRSRELEDEDTSAGASALVFPGTAHIGSRFRRAAS